MSTDSCKHCRATLGSLVKRHTVEQCPLISASYCGLCARYGHSPRGCPDAVTRIYREPQFLEQLLPPSLLEEYSIRTATPLKSVGIGAQLYGEERIWEVAETDEGLRAAVTNAGGKPMICQEKKGKKENREIQENKKKLQKLADEKGYKVIYIPTKLAAPATASEEPSEKKKITIKPKKVAATK